MDSIQKQNIKDVKKETVKFNDTVKASRRILFRAKTVFPFDLFLDEIVIDENKLNFEQSPNSLILNGALNW